MLADSVVYQHRGKTPLVRHVMAFFVPQCERGIIPTQAGGQEMASPSSNTKGKYTLISEGGGTYKVAGGEQINVSLVSGTID